MLRIIGISEWESKHNDSCAAAACSPSLAIAGWSRCGHPVRALRSPILPGASGSGCPREISAKQERVRLEPIAVCLSRCVPECLRILKTIARLPNLAPVRAQPTKLRNRSNPGTRHMASQLLG
jgi:hypothetical protein